MIRPILAILFTAACACHAAEFKLVGEYLLQSHFKLAGGRMIEVPVKPLTFRVYTDGVQVRISAQGDEEARTTYQIYRSDGIGRQRETAGALEIIPGLQATSDSGGTHRHLRLSRESMTITMFPGVSDQTIVTVATAVEPSQQTAAAAPTPARP